MRELTDKMKMQCVRLAGAIILAFVISMPWAWADENKCVPVAATRSQTGDLEALSKKITDHVSLAEKYFEGACRKEVVGLLSKPNTDWLRTSIPMFDQAGNQSQEFLRKVLDRVKMRHEKATHLAGQVKKCTAGGKAASDPSCKAIRNWVETQLPQITKLARFNLALAHHSPSSSFLKNNQELMLNAGLDDKKSPKATPWAPLNPSERAQAKNSFYEMQNNVVEAIAERSKGLSKKDQSTLYREELLKVRHSHYMIYLSLMGINPVLQSIRSAEPSIEEVNLAANETLKNLDKEKNLLGEIEAAINNPHPIGTAGNKTFKRDALKLLSYRTEVEEVLLENPQFCGLAVGLHQVKDNQQLELALIGLPVMAVSLLVPPMYGIAIGAGLSLLALHQSQSELSEAQVREGARIQREGMSDFTQTISTEGKTTAQITDDMQKDVTRVYRKNLQVLQQSEADRNTTVILGPALIFSPLAAKYIVSYSKTMRAAFSSQK